MMTIVNREDVVHKFEDRYTPDPNSGCWLWTGTYMNTGYGQMTVGYYDLRLAHRVSYELFIGPIPDGMHVRHKCDTKCCVNPDHLLIGTDQDNRTDMAKRGRGTKGRYPVGVFPHRKKFQAKIKYHSSYIYLGVHDTVEQAAAVVAAKRRELYG